MIEKIEITQRFNFKRLNRHYECFTIDMINNNAYYKISERGSGDKFLSEHSLCDSSWIDILVDLRKSMTSRIHNFTDSQKDKFLHDFDDLKLFDGFVSEEFTYFEKIELIYSCNVIIYSTDNFEEYSFKNNFPPNWIGFGEILKDYLEDKLDIKAIEFGHYQTYPYELPNPRLIINFSEGRIDGYIEKELTERDKKLILGLLERYHVYMWIFDEYHKKSNARDPDDLEGYDWYLEIVFEGDIIWHIFGYNDYPDTYVGLAREVIEITGMDLLEVDTISYGDLELFEKFGKLKLC